jgi:hypothetical protein
VSYIADLVDSFELLDRSDRVLGCNTGRSRGEAALRSNNSPGRRGEASEGLPDDGEAGECERKRVKGRKEK